MHNPARRRSDARLPRPWRPTRAPRAADRRPAHSAPIRRRWRRSPPTSSARSRSARRALRPSRRSAIRPTCRSRSAPTRSRRAIRAHPVVIVCGETGSGKTTQLPKICLAAGRGERGLIGHTQPRRIAARAVATRIAQELGDAARRGRRLQGALHRPDAARRVRQADDRRHPARGDAGRPRRSRPTTRSSSTRRTSAASTSTSCWAT